jgi:hypothetical protein
MFSSSAMSIQVIVRSSEGSINRTGHGNKNPSLTLIENVLQSMVSYPAEYGSVIIQAVKFKLV